MTKHIAITIEKMDDKNRLQKRETIVGIQIVKDYYNEAEVDQLLATINEELKPCLTQYLNAK